MRESHMMNKQIAMLLPYFISIRPDIVKLRGVFKLMLARWRSQPIKYRVQKRQPITERLKSISLKSHLRSRDIKSRSNQERRGQTGSGTGIY